MLYRVLGFAVWNGAKWYLRRRFGRRGPAPKLLAAGVVAAAVAGALAAGARHGGDR